MSGISGLMMMMMKFQGVTTSNHCGVDDVVDDVDSEVFFGVNNQPPTLPNPRQHNKLPSLLPGQHKAIIG